MDTLWNSRDSHDEGSAYRRDYSTTEHVRTRTIHQLDYGHLFE